MNLVPKQKEITITSLKYFERGYFESIEKMGKIVIKPCLIFDQDFEEYRIIFTSEHKIFLFKYQEEFPSCVSSANIDKNKYDLKLSTLLTEIQWKSFEERFLKLKTFFDAVKI